MTVTAAAARVEVVSRFVLSGGKDKDKDKVDDRDAWPKGDYEQIYGKLHLSLDVEADENAKVAGLKTWCATRSSSKDELRLSSFFFLPSSFLILIVAHRFTSSRMRHLVDPPHQQWKRRRP